MLKQSLQQKLGLKINPLQIQLIKLLELPTYQLEQRIKEELEQNIEFCNNPQDRKERLISEIAACNKKIAEYAKGIRDIYMDKVKGLISESDFIDLSKNFSAEKERLERAVADGEKQLSELDEKIEIGGNRRELIEKYTNSEHLSREMVETFIDYISVGRRIPGTRNVPIEIHWNF